MVLVYCTCKVIYSFIDIWNFYRTFSVRSLAPVAAQLEVPHPPPNSNPLPLFPLLFSRL